MPEKYKDEIEEILRKAGEAVPTQSREEPQRHSEDRLRESRESMIRRRAPIPGYRSSQHRPRITPGKLMLAGLVVLLIGIRFWPMIWVGLAMLVVAYLMYFVSPRSISYEKRWRGQPLEESPTSYWDRFKRWLRN